MRIRGNIRRGLSGVDVAFVHDDVWHNLTESPLKTNIEQLYNFLQSKEERATLFGRIYKKVRKSNRGNPSVGVSFRGGLCDLTLTKYQFTRDGRPAPSDKVSIEMIFQTISNEEDSTEEIFSMAEGDVIE